MIVTFTLMLNLLLVKLVEANTFHLNRDIYITETINSNRGRSCYRAKRLSTPNAQFEFCYPDIIVAGFPKCGTSFIFSILAKHPKVLKTRRKELCLGGIKSESWGKLISFFASPHDLESDKTSLSGCLHLGALVEVADSLNISKTKYIFTVRSVPEMLWAAYNYWCIVDVDENCSPGQRTTISSQRSPEHFHYMIANGKLMGGGISLTPDGQCFMPFLKRAIEVFGRHNVVVIKAEDMLPLVSRELRKEVLHRLLSDLNLDRFSRDYEDMFLSSSFLVNSGFKVQNRGEFVVTSSDNVTRSNVYEVSGYAPMLEKTKSFLSTKWNTERLWLKEMFSIIY
jgi:hypothetical protein